MHHRKAGLVVLVCTLGSLIAAAKAPPSLHYIKPDAINVLQLIPNPPARGSDEEIQDMATVLRVQESRTQTQIARGKAENKLSVFAFADVLGPGFSAGSCPLTAAFFKNVEADSKYFSKVGKEKWDRPRPPFASDRVKPPVEVEKEGSYPSGHSTRAMLYAQILAEVVPARREALLDRAQEIGWDRVIIGVHYPSDVYAGRALGQAIAFGMMGNADFQSELAKVKAELDGVLSAPTAPTAAIPDGHASNSAMPAAAALQN